MTVLSVAVHNAERWDDYACLPFPAKVRRCTSLHLSSCGNGTLDYQQDHRNLLSLTAACPLLALAAQKVADTKIVDHVVFMLVRMASRIATEGINNQRLVSLYWMRNLNADIRNREAHL